MCYLQFGDGSGRDFRDVLFAVWCWTGEEFRDVILVAPCGLQGGNKKIDISGLVLDAGWMS